MKCPICGSRLKGDAPDKKRFFNCRLCNQRFFLEDDGELVDVFHRKSSAGGPERLCENCGRSLNGGEYTAPWENGNNPDGYVKCPHCKYINFLWQ